MKKIVVFTLLSVLVFSCSGESEGKKEENESNTKPMEVKTADELESSAKKLDELIKRGMPNIDQQQYINAINAHYQLSQNYPDHEKAAYHLDKAQGYCQQIHDYPRSEKMLAQLFRDYPDYAAQNNGELYYLRATNLDFILGEGKNGAAYKREAKRIYQEFIDKFPDNPLVKEAQYRLENFDLTSEEIIANAKKKG